VVLHVDQAGAVHDGAALRGGAVAVAGPCHGSVIVSPISSLPL
jgi:hypothetical protein